MGFMAAYTEATPGLEIGVGGKPLCIYVLYGDLIFLSSGKTTGHQSFSSVPLAYWRVASICKGMSLKIRFQIIPEISLMSFLPFDSRSISEAILIAVGMEIIFFVELPYLSEISRSNLFNISSRTISDCLSSDS